MTDVVPAPSRNLRRAAIVTLLAGIVIGTAIYLFTPDDNSISMVEDFRNSKVYRHELELYGGKMSVMGDRLALWFSGLWQGRQLGITIAIGCAALAGAMILLAPPSQGETGGGNRHE